MLVQQHQSKTLDVQRERSEQIKQIKQQEEISAKKRMAEFEAIEAERQAQLKANREQRGKQDMLLFGVVGIALVGFILLLLVWALFAG